MKKQKLVADKVAAQEADTANVVTVENIDKVRYADPMTVQYTLAELRPIVVVSGKGGVTENVQPQIENIHPNSKELYLVDFEFLELFGMSKDQFKKLPGWKQKKLKKDNQLF